MRLGRNEMGTQVLSIACTDMQPVIQYRSIVRLATSCLPRPGGGLIRFKPRTATFRSISTAPTMQPKIATDQDEGKVRAELEELVDGGWQLDNEEIQLERTYHLSSYRSVKVGNYRTLIASIKLPTYLPTLPNKH